MYIKRKNRVGKAYAYQMFLSFKTSVTCDFFFNFTPDNCVGCEADLIGYNSIFCDTLSDV